MTDNHDLNTPDPGTTDWHEPLNANFEDLDELLRGIDSEGAVYSPDAVDDAAVNRNRILDTAGNVYDELTGSNDASKVQQAIDERPNDAGIVIPDPGFALDWNEGLELPAAEAGFTLESIGRPELRISEDFPDEYAIHKPASTDKAGSYNYTIGRFWFNADHDDNEDPTVPERLLYLDDTKGALVKPSKFDGARAIKIGASNRWSNQNAIVRPYIHSERGPGIEMEMGDPSLDDPEADQNWIFAPAFSEGHDHSADSIDEEEYTETAFLDHGRANMWLFPRCEFANRVHHQKGASRYLILEGQWDRAKRYEHTVYEEFNDEYDDPNPHGDVYGTIVSRKSANFAKMRLINPNTDVRSAGRLWSSTELVDFGGVTTAHSLEALGLRGHAEGGTADSDGGTVGIVPGSSAMPSIRLTTDGYEGDVVTLDTGPGTWETPAIVPKLFLETEVDRDSRNDDGVPQGLVVRAGLYADDADRVEFVFDPGEQHASHPGNPDNWYVELVTGDEVRARKDAGQNPYGYGRSLCLQREIQSDEYHNPGTRYDQWSAFVDRSRNDVLGLHNGGTPLAADKRFQFRVQLEATEAVEKYVELEGKHQRLLGMGR